MPKKKRGRPAGPKFPSFIKNAIKDTMARKGLTVSDLVKGKAGRSKNRLYEFLAGKADMQGTGLASLMGFLGLCVSDEEFEVAWHHVKPPVKKRKKAKVKGR